MQDEFYIDAWNRNLKAILVYLPLALLLGFSLLVPYIMYPRMRFYSSCS